MITIKDVAWKTLLGSCRFDGVSLEVDLNFMNLGFHNSHHERI